MASELRTRTAVGAAKPFGRPPILRLVQVVLAAYIGAGGWVKWGANHQIVGGGTSQVTQPCPQTPIRHQSDLKCTWSTHQMLLWMPLQSNECLNPTIFVPYSREGHVMCEIVCLDVGGIKMGLLLCIEWFPHLVAHTLTSGDLSCTQDVFSHYPQERRPSRLWSDTSQTLMSVACGGFNLKGSHFVSKG